MEPLTTEQEYQQMRSMLNEQQWRHYLAAEAQRRGSASTVAREAGVSLNTVKRGLREREAGQTYRPGARIRRPGAGRKKVAESDPTLLADLVQALEARGHHIKKSALAKLLHTQGFSLHVNKKTIEGTAHPDRVAQFAH